MNWCVPNKMLQGEGRSVSPVPSHWGAGRLAKRKADRETVEGGEWGVGSGEWGVESLVGSSPRHSSHKCSSAPHFSCSRYLVEYPTLNTLILYI